MKMNRDFGINIPTKKEEVKTNNVVVSKDVEVKITAAEMIAQKKIEQQKETIKVEKETSVAQKERQDIINGLGAVSAAGMMSSSKYKEKFLALATIKMSNDKTTTTSFRVYPDIYEKFKEQCERLNFKIADVMAEALIEKTKELEKL
jgi:L-lactate utilization protein LutC